MGALPDLLMKRIDAIIRPFKLKIEMGDLRGQGGSRLGDAFEDAEDWRWEDFFQRGEQRLAKPH